jgi:hypothetical protein
MNTRNITYIDWIKALPVNDNQYASSACPECGAMTLSYQYFGSHESSYGWKLVWCNSCKTGVSISRTKIPTEVHALIEDNDKKSFIEQHIGITLKT